MNYKNQLTNYSDRALKHGADAFVIKTADAKRIIEDTVQYVLEQIEEAKLSELGNVIEKLKQEYK